MFYNSDYIAQFNLQSGKGILRKRVLPAVAVGGTAVAAAPLALYALGFGAAGIVKGSIAAIWMSKYAGTVILGSKEILFLSFCSSFSCYDNDNNVFRHHFYEI